MSETTTKKRKASLPILIAGGVSSLVLALGMSPTFSAFTASILNDTNTATAGTLIMQETGVGGTCNSNDATPVGNTLGSNNAATCATINKYGGTAVPLIPGGSQTGTVTIKNTGTVTPTSFTLTPGTCTPIVGTPNGGASSSICANMNIKVYLGATATGVPLNGASGQPASTFSLLALTPLAPGATQQYTFQVTLASTADNTFQGLGISQPLTWKFQA